MQFAVGGVGWLKPSGKHRHLIGKVQPNATIAGADCASANPHDFAAGAQFVEVGRTIATNAQRQNLGFKSRGNQRSALQETDGFDQRIGIVSLTRDAMPHREKSGECFGFNGFDFASQRCQRTPAKLTQHIDIAPFARHATGPELAENNAFLGLDRAQCASGSLGRQTEPTSGIGRDKRAVRSGVAPHQFFERSRHRIGECNRQSHRQRTAERVAIASCIVGGDEAIFVGNANCNHAPLSEQRCEPTRRCYFATQINIGSRQVAHSTQHVVQFVGRTCSTAITQTLQFEFEVGQYASIEKLAQLFGTEQIAQ